MDSKYGNIQKIIGEFMYNNTRNWGLDIAMSTAIILVIVSHPKMFFIGRNSQFMSICGLLGVEFFCFEWIFNR